MALIPTRRVIDALNRVKIPLWEPGLWLVGSIARDSDNHLYLCIVKRASNNTDPPAEDSIGWAAASAGADVQVQIAAGVKAYARIGGPLIAGADANPSFVLQSEITQAFLLNIIGLTASEVNDAFIGAATVSYTHLTLPTKRIV